MAGIFERISLMFKSKASDALDKYEDPRQTLDYSYQRQLELLQKVRRGVADVATSRKRVELQVQKMNGEVDRLQSAAQRALESNREDLAREALTRKGALQQQLADLQGQHAGLQAEEEKLVRASTRLQAKVDAFRTRKETIKATYSAAEAQTRINEAFTGISEEMGDVGMAVQRAEDKTLELQARASAVDELLASGALQDPSGMAKDDITMELDQLAYDNQVESELAKMRAQIGGGSETRPQIDARPSAAQSQQQMPQQPVAQEMPTAEAVEGFEPPVEGQPPSAQEPYAMPPQQQGYQEEGRA